MHDIFLFPPEKEKSKKGKEEYTDKEAEKDCDEIQKAIKGTRPR